MRGRWSEKLVIRFRGVRRIWWPPTTPPQRSACGCWRRRRTTRRRYHETSTDLTKGRTIRSPLDRMLYAHAATPRVCERRVLERRCCTPIGRRARRVTPRTT
jgi:hypothetical protein